MHEEKLIKAMHEKAWTKTEINKATKILDKAKEKEPKGLSLFNYWSNIFFLVVIVIVTSISLTPILSVGNESFSIITIIIIGLIFGTLASHAIITLEDYNSKHHRIWGNLILFLVLLIFSYASLETALFVTNIEASAFKHALIYKASFAVFPAIIIIKHEVWMNKYLNKIKRKIKRKKK